MLAKYGRLFRNDNFVDVQEALEAVQPLNLTKVDVIDDLGNIFKHRKVSISDVESLNTKCDINPQGEYEHNGFKFKDFHFRKIVDENGEMTDLEILFQHMSPYPVEAYSLLLPFSGKAFFKYIPNDTSKKTEYLHIRTGDKEEFENFMGSSLLYEDRSKGTYYFNKVQMFLHEDAAKVFMADINGVNHDPFESVKTCLPAIDHFVETMIEYS